MNFDAYTTSQPAAVNDPKSADDLVARYVFEQSLKVGCRRSDDGVCRFEVFGDAAPAAALRQSNPAHQIAERWRFDPQRAWAVFVTDDDELQVQAIDDHSELASGVKPMNDSEAIHAARAAGLRVGAAAKILSEDGQPMWLFSDDFCRDDFERFDVKCSTPR